ncbi:MAG TPA: two-component system response regulator [Spirochaetia bacterium]|nr:MAG: hypothetical protein A2Y41_09175 [Spirochaetes bacterium GWB1_36_13]HCL58009.1 two-component system response regulator [Spirochaetia bacterium]
MSKNKILIIDDEKNVHYSFKRVFEQLAISSAYSAEEGLEKLSAEKDFNLIICDIKMPGLSGLELLEKLKKDKIEIPVIIITAHGTLENAINAIQNGAYDYLIKPFDFQKLKTVIFNALNLSDKESSAKVESSFKNELIVGDSLVMQEIYKEIAKVAGKDVTVLVTGESGTGKELIAKAVHYYSLRRNSPFVAVNCGAIPSELMESELFGYEKGAFTGAVKRTAGKFQQAENGTLFLDEIGELPPHLQVKILRALQEREIMMLGSSEPVKVNVRIIAATNKDLKEEIKQGVFREDLYYRLNVVRIHLPPLRDRKEDIAHLVKRFIENINKNHHLKINGIAQEALEKLQSYDFPGNIRELENIITRAAIHCHSDRLEAGSIELDSSEELYLNQIEKNIESLANVLFEKGVQVDSFMEKTVLNMLLKKFDYNQSKTAEYLHLNRNTLRKKLKDFNII